MNTYEKMRKALMNVSSSLCPACRRRNCKGCPRSVAPCMQVVRNALALQRRNCDVGTAEEQVERFKEYCQSNMQYYCDMFGTHEGAGGWDRKKDCPISKMVDKNDYLGDHCQLLWAQMPYEEGGEE